ncbi:MAG: GldG family protein [Methylotenera sp.]|nr:GldG family protein [Oligoflexia bacterium]
MTKLLWTSTVVSAFALLFARAVYPEYLWLTLLFAAVLIGSLGTLAFQNKSSMGSKSAAHGLNSLITVILVLCILGVLNFLGSRYPQKWDLTKNKKHTLSDQTTKVVKGLKEPVKAVLFSKAEQREELRPLLDNLKGLNPKFEVEYVDPDKEPTRSKQAGIKAYGTLQLLVGARESKIDSANEEKLTNALIKLLKDKALVLCTITGHGEKDFDSAGGEGYQLIKKALADQSYEVKPVNLIQEGKIPDVCQAITILGPTKAFFEAETKVIRDYLEKGGRALIATDVNVKGTEYSPEISFILKSWNIKPVDALIIDPVSRVLQLEPTVPIIATYSKESPITKEFQGNAIFPMCRPLEIMPGAPEAVKLQWIAQTTPQSWGETNFTSIAQGKVQMDGPDLHGPLNAAVVVDGKRTPQAKRNTRLVVYGTSNFASNQFARFGNNTDFFLNSVSWLLEDESLISIRTKTDEGGKIELSQKQGASIFLLTVIAIPLLTAIAGIVIWFMRKKL